MINVINIRELIDYNDEKSINLMIVRYMKEPIASVVQFDRLAPSETLLNAWNNSGKLNEDWEIFKAAFLKEMERSYNQIGLKLVKQYSDAGYTVNLICYCSDAYRCHRSLVADLLEDMELEVNR